MWKFPFSKIRNRKSLSLEEQRKIEKLRLTVLFDFKCLFESWDKDNDYFIPSYQIHLIECKFLQKNNTFDIIITLSRPGLIIGKAGRNLNKIKENVISSILKNINKKDDNFNVDISLKEFNPFSITKELKELEKYENS